MNFKLLRRSFGATMIALVTIVASLSSCSSNNDVAGVIPADVKFAMRFDFKQMIENTGCTFSSDGKIELSPELKAALADQPQYMAAVQMILGYTEGFDLADLAFFMRSNNEPLAVITLTDQKKVTDNIAQFLGQPKNEKGFDVFSVGSGKIAIKDNRLWVADDIEDINDALEAAKRKHIGTMPGLDQFLNADNAFAFIISGNAIDLPSNFSNQWICASIRFAGSEASGEMCMMDPDGKRYPFGDAFGEISTDFLNYIPSGMSIVGALGQVKEPALKDAIAKYARQMGEYSKYVTGIDGTIAGAIDLTDAVPTSTSGMINGDYDFNKIKFLVMAHYPQALADSLILEINDRLMLNGQFPVREQTGVYTFSQQGMEFYFGNVGGYAALANYPLIPTGENELASKFEGRRGVIYTQSMPTGMFGVDYASDGIIWLESDALKFQGRLIGTDKKFLQAVVDIMLTPEFRQLMEMAVNQAYGDMDYAYDYDNYDDEFMPDEIDLNDPTIY